MATNKSMKAAIVVTLMITIAIVLLSTVPCDAGRYKPIRPPPPPPRRLCPACVCCKPAPPGVCCGCCPIPAPEPPPPTSGYAIKPEDQHAP